MISMPRPSALLNLLIAAACAACSSGSPSAAEPDAGSVPVVDAPIGCMSEPDLDNYAAGLKKLGDTGRFEFELVSSDPSPPSLDNNTFVVRMTGSGSAVPVNGVLSVALDMPEHGHSSPKSPTITFDPNAQVFTLDPMDLFMVGLWRITFTFATIFREENGAGGSAGESDAPMTGPPDSAVFKFCIE